MILMMPRHWPAPIETTPCLGGNPLPSGPGVECTRWEAQLSGRAIGPYWVYESGGDRFSGSGDGTISGSNSMSPRSMAFL